MLKIDIRGQAMNKVARVIMDRPAVHNAFNEELIALLTDVFTDLAQKADIRAVVIAGTGKSFSAGADLHWMKRMAENTREENLRDAKTAARMFLAVATCPKPVIARVHGAALGGGAGLIAACDIAVAVESAQFGFTEVKVGIIPSIISPFVLAKIGPAHAREYFLTGERFPAAVARDIGLVQHVVKDEAAMDALIEAKIAEILTSSPEAVRMAKQLIFSVVGRPPESVLDLTAEAIARARATDDARAGFAAFLARSKPPWAPPS